MEDILQGKGYGKGCRASMPLWVQLPGSSLIHTLLVFYGGFTMKARLIKSMATGNKFNLQPLSHDKKGVGGGRLEAPPFSSQSWFH
jgi:hypothetical protein